MWEKYLFNNQDSQGYRRQDVVWGGGGVEIQNIPLSYDGGVVDCVVSSVE